jgi:hypothetical protein
MCKRADPWPFLLGLQISKSYPNILKFLILGFLTFLAVPENISVVG